MMQKGFKHSKKTIEKMRIAAFNRDNKPRIEALPKGKTHWRWSKKPTLLTLHKRIHRKYGPARLQKCAVDNCENMAHDWANKNGRYTDKVEDYEPMCRSHHIKKDKNWIKRK